MESTPSPPPHPDPPRAPMAVVLLCLAAASAAGLGVGLVSCEPPDRTPVSIRPLDAAQARRLAAMRYDNQQDGGVGFQATVGDPDTGVRLRGWIDWRRPLVYFAGRASQPGDADGLVEAVPGLVAIHTGAGVAPVSGMKVDRTATAPAVGDPGPFQPPPPSTPPEDGWQVRRLDPASTSAPSFDALITLLFLVAADRPDDSAALASSGAQFVRRDEVSGVPVDVIAAPAVGGGSGSPGAATSPVTSAAPPVTSAAPPMTSAAPPMTSAAPPMTSAAPAGGGPALLSQLGASTYWLDDDARLRRLDALLHGNEPVRVDFDRTTPAAPVAIQALGGGPVAPSAVTAAQAQTLAGLAARDRTAGGGQVTVSLPTGEPDPLRAYGWLDWHGSVAYLAVHDRAGSPLNGLLRADRAGVSTRGPVPVTGTVPDGGPPLRPPSDGWTQTSWKQRGEDQGPGGDLDLLLSQALAMDSAPASAERANELRRTASWLRTDVIDGTAVTVFEIRTPAESSAVPGQGRLRYWIDGEGVLRRLEIRTAIGAYGYLDVTPGTVPVLPRPAGHS